MTIQHVPVPVNAVTDYPEVPLAERTLAFVRNPLFAGDRAVLHGPNPYRRSLMPGAHREVDFTRPLAAGDWPTYRSLAAHRLLWTFY